LWLGVARMWLDVVGARLMAQALAWWLDVVGRLVV
jgi:hypothetical protein